MTPTVRCLPGTRTCKCRTYNALAEYQYGCSFDDLSDQYCGLTSEDTWRLTDDSSTGAYEGRWYQMAQTNTARS